MSLEKDKFDKKLREALYYQLERSQLYRYMFDKLSPISISELDNIPTKTLIEVLPFILTDMFKFKKGVFHLLTYIDIKNSASDFVVTLSSGTTGETSKSVEIRSKKDVHFIVKEFETALKMLNKGKEYDVSFIFFPHPREISQPEPLSRYIGLPAYPFLSIVIGVHLKAKEMNYVLKNGKVDFEEVFKRIARRVLKLEKNEKIAIGGSTILTYRFLEYMEEKNLKLKIGERGFVQVGAGGWSGRKGRKT